MWDGLSSIVLEGSILVDLPLVSAWKKAMALAEVDKEYIDIMKIKLYYLKLSHYFENTILKEINNNENHDMD